MFVFKARLFVFGAEDFGFSAVKYKGHYHNKYTIVGKYK